MLAMETSEMRWLLTLSMSKPRQNAKAIFKTYEEIIYGAYITLIIHFTKIC
jgi:hypothetical protein